MSIQTATRNTTLPRVNLIPPEIGERKKLQQAQAVVAGGVVLALVGAGYLYYQGTHDVSRAKQQLAAATAANNRLVKEVATYSDVRTTASQLQSSEAMLTQAASTEVRWSQFLSDFGSIPGNTWMTKLSLTNALPAGSLPTSSDAPPTVGQVSVDGVATKYNELATWLDGLAKEQDAQQRSLLSNVYFSAANETFIGATKVVDFQGSADLTSASLSGRCAQPGSC